MLLDTVCQNIGIDRVEPYMGIKPQVNFAVMVILMVLFPAWRSRWEKFHFRQKKLLVHRLQLQGFT